MHRIRNLPDWVYEATYPVRKLFKPKAKLFNTSYNHLVGSFESLWQAERCLNLMIEQEKDWGSKSNYVVKIRNKVMISR